MTRPPAKFYIKSAWVLLWLLMLNAYQLDKLEIWPSEILAYGHYVSPEWVEWLEPLMFFSCFPVSLFYALLVSELACPTSYTCPADKEILFWMGLFAFGTLQWFKLVPYFFRAVSITTLDLSTAKTPSTTDAASSEATPHAPPAEPATNSQQTRTQEASVQETQRRESPVSHFDERGRTPLERVFDASD